MRVFVAKLDKDLNPLWAVSFGAPGNAPLYNAYTNQVVYNAATNQVIISARDITTNMDFDGTVTSGAGYVTALSATTGAVQWVQGTTPGNFDVYLGAVACDKSGSIYGTGYFKGIFTIAGLSVTEANGWETTVVFRLTPTGTGDWIQTILPANSNSKARGTRVVVDNVLGRLYVGGDYWENIIVGPVTITSPYDSNFNIFVASMDSATGQTVHWARGFGGFYTDCELTRLPLCVLVACSGDLDLHTHTTTSIRSFILFTCTLASHSSTPASRQSATVWWWMRWPPSCMLAAGPSRPASSLMGTT